MSDALILKMQKEVTDYLKPKPYEQKRPDGVGRRERRERRELFISRIIYFLDSEEHGTNVRKTPTTED